MYGASIHTSETIIIKVDIQSFWKMLSISNFGSSRICQSHRMLAYLKSWANQTPVACNPMHPYGMLKLSIKKMMFIKGV